MFYTLISNLNDVLKAFHEVYIETYLLNKNNQIHQMKMNKNDFYD